MTLGGSDAVATVSGARCAIKGDEVDVSGTIAATAPAPSGLTVYASIRSEPSGAGTGMTAQSAIPPTAVGQPHAFDGVITGTDTVRGDQCHITWVANAASTS